MNVDNFKIKQLNLKELFEKRFKIAIDESAFQLGESKDNPWYFQVPCKYGHIYPYSDKVLGFYCESGNIRKRLNREHPGIEIINWSDDGEAVFLFTPDQFDLIAKYAKPKRKKRLSQDHRRKLTSAGTDALKRHRKSIQNGTKTGQISTKRTLDVISDGQAREKRLENQKSEIKG